MVKLINVSHRLPVIISPQTESGSIKPHPYRYSNGGATNPSLHYNPAQNPAHNPTQNPLHHPTPQNLGVQNPTAQNSAQNSVHNRVTTPPQHASGYYGNCKFKSSSGSMMSTRSGMASLKGLCTLTVGWIGEFIPEQNQKEFSAHLLATEYCSPVFLSTEAAIGHYDIFCKTALWPLFHYLVYEKATNGRVEKKAWAHYQEVNQKFADKAVEVYEPGDLIWVHDYHLMLCPAMIRQALPDAKIGFFLHTPFPTSELFKVLPQRKEILTGILGADVAGFQTYSYSRHFLSVCSRLLECETSPKGVEYKGWFLNLGIFPIGIDYDWLESERKEKGVVERVESLKKLFGDKKIIISRDKLDPIRGVKHKLIAFERFLQKFPEWRNKVVLVQVTTPRALVAENDMSQNLEVHVTEIVSRINGTFGNLHRIPVHYINQKIPRDQYYALLSIADACLITSTREGMNLTSHEFIVCQNEKKSPLILSEFTGASGSLGDALHVNPWDYEGVAFAIEEALSMPMEEKVAKHNSLVKFIKTHTVQFWCQTFVTHLLEAGPLNGQHVPDLNMAEASAVFASKSHRLIMLDYDGTLTPIVKTPEAAAPTEELLRVLRNLSQLPETTVFVISGRDQQTLDSWIGQTCPHVGLSAEHGSFLKWPGPGQKWLDLTRGVDFSWKEETTRIFEFYTERTPGSFIEMKKCSITWHYRLADPVYGVFQAQECKNHFENAVVSKLPLEILTGKKNLEIRPRFLNKGEIVTKLLSSYPKTEFVFCAGDDKTDEDMFHSIASSSYSKVSYSCLVGDKKTVALNKMESPAEIVQFLQMLIDTQTMTKV